MKNKIKKKRGKEKKSSEMKIVGERYRARDKRTAPNWIYARLYRTRVETMDGGHKICSA